MASPFVAIVAGVNVAYGITGRPFAHDPIEQLPPYMTEYGTVLAVGASMATIAWVGLALFAAGLVVSSWVARRGHIEGWALVGLVGVVMQNAIFAAVVSTDVALLARVRAAAEADALLDLWALHNALMSVNGISLVIVLVGFSLAILRTGLAPHWLAGAGLVAAALILTGPLQVAAGAQGTNAVGPFLVGFVIWLAWVGVLGTRMMLGRTSQPGR